jgi:hypothetical protein
MSCIQADPILFCAAMVGLAWAIYTGKLRPSNKPKPAAPVDLRSWTASELFDAPHDALLAEEQRLIGVYLDDMGRNAACRSRIDDVLRAKNWQLIGGPRPEPRQPAIAKPKPEPSTARATRRSTELVVVPAAPAPAHKASERWRQIRHG